MSIRNRIFLTFVFMLAQTLWIASLIGAEAESGEQE